MKTYGQRNRDILILFVGILILDCGLHAFSPVDRILISIGVITIASAFGV